MELSNRLTRAAAVNTWLILFAVVLGVTLMEWVASPVGVTVHPSAAYAWNAVGAAAALGMSLLPMLLARSPWARDNVAAIGLFLFGLVLIWATAVVSVTGGIRGPLWVCFFGAVLYARVSLPAPQALLMGLASTGGLVGASNIAHTLDRALPGRCCWWVSACR